LFKNAKGLLARGRQVFVLPLLPCPTPPWVDGEFGDFITL